MKLLLFISHSGTLSRRKAFDAIQSGFVTVNGEKVQEPSFKIDPDKDHVLVQGRPVDGKHFEYVLLNKPAGYVTTCEGQFKQRTVMDILPKELQHLRPVGRLDKETEGLLLLTNDGDLAHRLMHPSFDVDKTYSARVRWYFTPQSVEKLERGVILFGERTAPAQVKVLGVGDKESEIEITIHEGKKRQVRLMLDAVGNPVVQLTRLRQGSLLLGNLPTGEWRRLSEDELTALRRVKPLSKFPESEKRERSFDREDKGAVRPARSFGRQGRGNDFRARPSREGGFAGDDRGGRSREPYREERAPRERTERSFLEGKPAFSSHSDKRRFSSTRQWHSPSDAHRPVEGALIKSASISRTEDPRERFISRENRGESRSRSSYGDRPSFRSASREGREGSFPRDDRRNSRSRPSYGDRLSSGERAPFGRSSFGKPSFAKSSSAKSSFGKSSFGRPSLGKPPSGKPASGKPAFGKPPSGRPSFGKKTFNKKPYNKPVY